MFVSKEEMLDWLDNFDVEVARAIGVRLNSNVDYIVHLDKRLRLAERVVGELYLMTQEEKEEE
jgi:hypothetical protein